MPRHKIAKPRLYPEDVHREIHGISADRSFLRRLLPALTSTGAAAAAAMALSSKLGGKPLMWGGIGLTASAAAMAHGNRVGQSGDADLRRAVRLSRPGLLRRIASYVVPGVGMYDLGRDTRLHERIAARYSSLEQLREDLKEVKYRELY